MDVIRTVNLFDSNCFIGMPARGGVGDNTVHDLVAAMDKAGIDRALVWHIAELDCAPDVGNRMLSDAIEQNNRLLGCWTILPPQTEEIITDGFFDRMKEQRVAALRVFPTAHKYLLNRTVFGGFLDQAVDRNIPLMLSLQSGVDWPTIYQLLEEFPKLTCILCDFDAWSQHRYFWPLLETFPNVCAETSMVSLQAGGLEATVRAYGAERLVFGTGFPNRYAEAPAMDLLHADISDADKLAIASGNMERLISEVKL
jgi:uncharacterized protein